MKKRVLIVGCCVVLCFSGCRKNNRDENNNSTLDIEKQEYFYDELEHCGYENVGTCDDSGNYELDIIKEIY